MSELMQQQPVQQKIGNIALLVADYDDAIAFYTSKLQFSLIADTDIGDGKRWIEIAPPNSNGSHLLLAKASNAQQQAAVGNQTGGRVFLFLHTNDFWRDYHAMQAKGVKFNEQPREESYGTVAVFEDLYGNKWDLLQLHPN
ncbi:VOC family protein [Rheinheimera baltica]|uniref:VOC family protein n=1 Tax=Rheinheimera baltica TaxID=67576 RepID=UPI00273F3CB3|nr:VOC family protein [Rheinheimera baltica]MDP5141492.1 VOC family protein [Rheinheimera baltica]